MRIMVAQIVQGEKPCEFHFIIFCTCLTGPSNNKKIQIRQPARNKYVYKMRILAKTKRRVRLATNFFSQVFVTLIVLRIFNCRK